MTTRAIRLPAKVPSGSDITVSPAKNERFWVVYPDGSTVCIFGGERATFTAKIVIEVSSYSGETIEGIEWVRS